MLWKKANLTLVDKLQSLKPNEWEDLQKELIDNAKVWDCLGYLDVNGDFQRLRSKEKKLRGSAGMGEANAEQGKRRRGSEATERVRPWWEEQRQAQRA